MEARLGTSFHWKTPGMTLSRLRKDRMADYDGRLWRFVPSMAAPLPPAVAAAA
ncbi:MAG TPA: hypothetical protein VES42_19250 [Pilimelia sp.]|nr:hypothetical protein [Pilimelia sp.]